MTSESKRKTLVGVDLSIWAKVKHFATIKEVSVNDAVRLLRIALLNCGYNTIQKQILMPSGRSLTASSQNAASVDIQ